MPQSDAFGDLLGGLGMGSVAPAPAATNNVTASADEPSILSQPGVYATHKFSTFSVHSSQRFFFFHK